jgi:hypothetical protein
VKKITIPCLGGPVVSINCCSVMDCQESNGADREFAIAVAPALTKTCASPAGHSHDWEAKSANG